MGMNPHLFASPRMAAQMTRSIAGQLADLDPANAATYWANAENYARTLDALADEFGALGGKLKNSRIITQHGVFDYLARDMGLDVVAVIQADDTQAPSASDMMKLIKAIRSQHVGAIFTEPQYPDKVAPPLSRKPGSPRQSWTPSPRGRPSHRWTITKKPCAPTCTRWRAPLEPTNAVVFRDVSVRRSGLAILEHVNATVPQGSCTVIVGPNGAGKTTLILALIGEMRHDGDIDVMTGRSGKPLRLGYVPQRISIDRGMPLTVVEFLVMGIQKRPLWLGIRPSLKAHSLELLSMVKAEHLASRRLGDLSGGEMQRVLLALALQQELEPLVLDEPSAGVDFSREHLFCELLDELRAAMGFTQLMVSHDLGMVFHHATHVICLKRHVFAEGSRTTSADARKPHGPVRYAHGPHQSPCPHRGPAKGFFLRSRAYRLVSCSLRVPPSDRVHAAGTRRPDPARADGGDHGRAGRQLPHGLLFRRHQPFSLRGRGARPDLFHQPACRHAGFRHPRRARHHGRTAEQCPLLGYDLSAYPSAVMAFTSLVSRDNAVARDLQQFLYGDILTITETDIRWLIGLFFALAAFQIWGYNRLLYIGLNSVVAKAHRINVFFWQYLFAGLLALVVMFSVWAVGVLLVTALLIVPAATARNLARTAGGMFWWSLLVSVTSAVAGLVLSAQEWAGTATGATVVLVSCGWFLLSAVLAAIRGEGRRQ